MTRKMVDMMINVCKSTLANECSWQDLEREIKLLAYEELRDNNVYLDKEIERLKRKRRKR